MVDVRCSEPDAARMMLVLCRFGVFEVALMGGEGTTEGIEGDYVIN